MRCFCSSLRKATRPAPICLLLSIVPPGSRFRPAALGGRAAEHYIVNNFFARAKLR
jgi:hypothetical protein